MVAAVTPTRLTLRPAFRKCEPRVCPTVSPQFDVRLVVRVVTHVRGPEVGDAGDRHARAVVVGAGQCGATSRELTAQLIASCERSAPSSTIR